MLIFTEIRHSITLSFISISTSKVIFYNTPCVFKLTMCFDLTLPLINCIAAIILDVYFNTLRLIANIEFTMCTIFLTFFFTWFRLTKAYFIFTRFVLSFCVITIVRRLTIFTCFLTTLLKILIISTIQFNITKYFRRETRILRQTLTAKILFVNTLFFKSERTALIHQTTLSVSWRTIYCLSSTAFFNFLN